MTEGTSTAGDGAPASLDRQSARCCVKAPEIRFLPRDLKPPTCYLPPQVDLVLANTYSQWNGHNSDAFKVYDKLIKTYPDDFRAYLAKARYLESPSVLREGRLFCVVSFSEALSPSSCVRVCCSRTLVRRATPRGCSSRQSIWRQRKLLQSSIASSSSTKTDRGLSRLDRWSPT